MTQAPDVITRSSNNCLDNKRRDNVLTPPRTKRRDLQGQWFETANAVILYVYDARKSSNHPYSPSCLARCSPTGGQQSDVFAHNSAWTIASVSCSQSRVHACQSTSHDGCLVLYLHAHMLNTTVSVNRMRRVLAKGDHRAVGLVTGWRGQFSQQKRCNLLIGCSNFISHNIVVLWCNY